MEKKGISIVTSLLLLGLGALSALEERIELGVDDRWADIRRLENVIVREGFRGSHDLLLQQSREPLQAATDLLLTFDGTPVRDAAGRYDLAGDEVEISTSVRRIGDASAVFRGASGGIALEPYPGAAFHSATFWESLQIEFWINPSTLQDGETILQWDGTRRLERRVVPQRVRVFVRNRRLVWEFLNVFVPPTGGEQRVTITGHAGIVPRRWSHHQLRYDARIGRLEYLVDRIPEGVEHTTSTGAERGDAFAAYIGDATAGALRIGPGYHGFLDELRITHGALPGEPRLPFTPPPQAAGVALSAPLALGNRGARLVAFDATWDAPGNSDVRFFYRFGDERMTIDDVDGEWIPFDPGVALRDVVEGRFVQLRIELLPDGSGSGTPRVSDISIVYEPHPPPPAPRGVAAVAADGAVELSWNPIRGADVEGYLVYYGESPGAYFGDRALAGPSPIDVGNTHQVTIDGLDNGRAYYFAVASYSRFGAANASRLSSEVFARPTRFAR